MRKYKSIRVGKQIYVDSLGHYHFRIYGDCGGKIYALGFGFDDWANPPAYVVRDVQNQIADIIESGRGAFYERDRDGNPRYENLRYHDPDLLSKWVSILRNPPASLSAQPRGIFFLILLLTHSNFYILRTKHKKRWEGGYLVNPKPEGENDAMTVLASFSPSEVECAMPWLIIAREGTNARGKMYQHLTAKNRQWTEECQR